MTFFLTVSTNSVFKLALRSEMRASTTVTRRRPLASRTRAVLLILFRCHSKYCPPLFCPPPTFFPREYCPLGHFPLVNYVPRTFSPRRYCPPGLFSLENYVPPFEKNVPPNPYLSCLLSRPDISSTSVTKRLSFDLSGRLTSYYYSGRLTES